MAIYVETAIEAGIDEICFTDHLHRYYLSPAQRRRYNDWGIPKKLLGNYFREIESLRRLYDGRIRIRSGLEVDFVEGAEHLAARIFETYPCDFLLGSIHCLPSLGWHHLSNYAESDRALAYSKYFEAAQAALQSGLFQSLTHLDVLWRYIPWLPDMQEQLSKDIAATVAVAKKVNVAMEINAGGYEWSRDHAAPEYDPFDVLIASIAQEHVSITLGSDAHSPDSVGRYFPEIIQKLQSHGITVCAVFEEKKRRSVTLG